VGVGDALTLPLVGRVRAERGGGVAPTWGRRAPRPATLPGAPRRPSREGRVREARGRPMLLPSPSWGGSERSEGVGWRRRGAVELHARRPSPALPRRPSHEGRVRGAWGRRPLHPSPQGKVAGRRPVGRGRRFRVCDGGRRGRNGRLRRPSRPLPPRSARHLPLRGRMERSVGPAAPTLPLVGRVRAERGGGVAPRSGRRAPRPATLPGAPRRPSHEGRVREAPARQSLVAMSIASDEKNGVSSYFGSSMRVLL